MNIIQTWKTTDIPDQYINLVQSVVDHNPKWKLMFFSDKDIIDFIETQMPEYKTTFFSLSNKIEQIDFFRYLAIYHYGGVYLDLDMLVECSLDELYDNPCVCKFPIEYENIQDNIITDQNYHNLIGNYAFYAPAKHAFIKKIIDNIVNKRLSSEDVSKAQQTNGDSALDVEIYCRTGPILVTQSYIDFANNQNIELLSTTPFSPERFGKYAKHYCMGSWRK